MFSVVRKMLLAILAAAGIGAGICILRSRHHNRWMRELDEDSDW